MPQSNIRNITQFNADIKRIFLYDDSTAPRRVSIPGEFDYFAVSKVSIPAVGADPAIQDDAIEFSTDGQRYFKAPRGMRFRLPTPTRDLWVKLSDAYTDECTVEVLCGLGDVADFRWVYNGETLSVALDAFSIVDPLPVREMGWGRMRKWNGADGVREYFSANNSTNPQDIVLPTDNVNGIYVHRAAATLRSLGDLMTSFGFLAYDPDIAGIAANNWFARFLTPFAPNLGDTVEANPIFIGPGLGLRFGTSGPIVVQSAFTIHVSYSLANAEGI